MGVSLVEMLIGLFILGMIGIGLIALAVAVFSSRRPRLGHATLNCPHCGAETRADRQKCTACQADL
jgi:hypothetical protein